MARRRCVVLPIVFGGCLGTTPELDYGASTGEATSPTSTTPSSSTTMTTAMSTTTMSTTDPPDTSSSSEEGDTSSTSTGASTTGTDTDEPPTEHGPCSPVPSALTLTRAGSTWTVANDEIEAAFDADANSTLASLVDPELPVELIHTADEPHEHFAGIGYFVAEAADEYSWRGTDATLTVLEDGPAVVRVQVDWTTDHASTEASLAGTSIYTIIPDGRLVRDESVTLAHSGTPDTTCWLTAYLALDVALFSQVQTNFTLMCAEPKTPMECTLGELALGYGAAIHGYGSVDADAWVCATDDGSARSVSWMTESDSATGPGTDGASARVGEVHADTGDYSLALQFDWYRESAIPAGTFGVHTVTYLDADDTDPCACSMQHFDAYGTPPTIDPTDTSFVEYRSAGAYFDVGVAGSPVALEFTGGAIPPTMLLRLEGPTMVTGVALDDDDLDEGIDYLTQASMEGDAAWLYLARPIATNQTLSIETSD